MISKAHAAQFIKTKHPTYKSGNAGHATLMTAVVYLNATCGWDVYRSPASVPLDYQLAGNLADLLGEYGVNVNFPAVVSILRDIATTIVPMVVSKAVPMAVCVDDDPYGPVGVHQRAFDTLCLMCDDVPSDTTDRFLGLIGRPKELQPATFSQTTKLVNNFGSVGKRVIERICSHLKVSKLEFQDA